MKFLPAAIAAMLLVTWTLTTPLAAQRGRSRDDGGQNGWMSDYQAARREARRSGRPLMVVLRCVP